MTATPPKLTPNYARWWTSSAAGMSSAKRLTSPYQPGIRSRHWINAPLNQTTEVIIAGWKPGEGRRAGMIGSLVLGAYDQAGRLVFTGGVGTGFTEQMLTDLARQLRPL